MKSWLEIVRFPNVFAVVADVLMGYLFVHEGLAPAGAFLALATISVLLYWAGMILNDVFDLELDRNKRSERPLVSGRITLSAAKTAGWGFLLAGVAIAWCLSVSKMGTEGWWRTGLVATILAACVVLYDGPLKKTAVAPLIMGACRMFNVLLAMSTGLFFTSDQQSVLLGYSPAQWCVAGGIGLFVAGITLFARRETKADIEAGSDIRISLTSGVVVMAAGLMMLAMFPRLAPFADGARQFEITPGYVWPLLVAALGLSLLRRCGMAIANSDTQRIQIAVRQCLVSLIVFNAAICLAVRTPVWWAVLIVSLVIPMVVLSRKFATT